jgi:acetyl esterase/lipase
MALMRRLGVAALALVAGCSPVDLLNATVSGSGVSVIRDVAFGAGPRMTLDVYQPVRALGPLVVFLYGGSWRTGDKSMYPFVAKPLAARGAVVVVPNYRLYPQVLFPDFLHDNAQAVAWSLRHAAELGADPGRVFLVGHSAGAYNAAMLALDPVYLEQAGTSRDQLAGVAGLAGPYDFLPMTDPDIIPVFAPVNNGPASQPVNYVDGRNPPLLLLAGDADTIVRPRNTVSLAKRVAAAGGRVATRIYPGVGHIGIVTAFAPLFSGKGPVLDDVWSFVAAGGAERRGETSILRQARAARDTKMQTTAADTANAMLTTTVPK